MEVVVFLGFIVLVTLFSGIVGCLASLLDDASVESAFGAGWVFCILVLSLLLTMIWSNFNSGNWAVIKETKTIEREVIE